MSQPPSGPRDPHDPYDADGWSAASGAPDEHGSGEHGWGEHGSGEPRDAVDPVAAFFAAERDDVRPLAADEVRWQRITREARSRRRQGPLRWVAAAAAVLVVGGGVAGLVGRHQSETVASAPRPTVTRTVYVDPSPTAADPTAATPSSPSTSAPPATTTRAGVPADLRLVSVSSVASGRLWGLGSATCAGTPCALVVTSTDRGTSWSVAGTVPGVTAGPARPVSGGAAGVGAAADVTDVRFADDRTGWVFGAQVLRTTDGGRTWTTYAHGGGPVLGLETDGREVVLAAADRCTAATCTGDVTVSRAAVADASAAPVGAPYGVGQGYAGLEVAWRARTAYVAVVGGSQASVPVQVGTTSVTPLGGPDCGASVDGGALVVAAADGSRLLGFCRGPGSAGSAHLLAPQTSADGTTWTPGPSGASVALPDAPLLSAAAADGTRLVVAAGASGGGASDVEVSVDGGATWAAPASLHPPDGGFGWLGASGGGTYLALPAVPNGSFWRSADAGRTWQEVRVAG
ncbi:hypothetical protein [Lapillicoccus jejuensis]|uniref:BNR/Asp-box repeat protein n=1 Tax=Lapillicoccus jejuensis TaxID=402171 RepID=A0A542DWU5_9MICO|nr:hypothetical protein [Lapillicoccus jejuensis]TQJ07553.1 hypothetical protein FB458_0618 [Lapillicoccus jejuensis]